MADVLCLPISGSDTDMRGRTKASVSQYKSYVGEDAVAFAFCLSCAVLALARQRMPTRETRLVEAVVRR